MLGQSPDRDSDIWGEMVLKSPPEYSTTVPAFFFFLNPFIYTEK